EAPRPGFDRAAGEKRREPCADVGLAEQSAPRGPAQLVPGLCARERLYLVPAHSARPQSADQRADARAGDDVDVEAARLEIFDDDDMRQRVHRAAPTHETD